MTMDEYANKFLELLRNVKYIKDESVKIQRFISGLPQFSKDINEFDEHQILDETMPKDNYCYKSKLKKIIIP